MPVGQCIAVVAPAVKDYCQMQSQPRHCHYLIYEILPPLLLMSAFVYLWTFFLSFSVFCRIYITEHSYVSVKTKVSASAQEILKIVAEKIQHVEEDLALVVVTFSGGK